MLQQSQFQCTLNFYLIFTHPTVKSIRMQVFNLDQKTILYAESGKVKIISDSFGWFWCCNFDLLLLFWNQCIRNTERPAYPTEWDIALNYKISIFRLSILIFVSENFIIIYVLTFTGLVPSSAKSGWNINALDT